MDLELVCMFILLIIVVYLGKNCKESNSNQDFSEIQKVPQSAEKPEAMNNIEKKTSIIPKNKVTSPPVSIQLKKDTPILPVQEIAKQTLPETNQVCCEKQEPIILKDSISNVHEEIKEMSYIKVGYVKKEENIEEEARGLDYIPAEYTIIDLETTGLNPKEDSIIEISCIKMREGKEVERFNTLIKPPIKISASISKLTGINDAMIEEAKAPRFEEIAKELWEFLKDEIIVGHNVKFDINFLYENFFNTIKLKFVNKYLDTLPLSRKIYKGLKSYKLEILSKKLGIEIESHRAMNDCVTVKELIKDMTERIIKEKIAIYISAYGIEEIEAEKVSKYVMNMIKKIEEYDYEEYEKALDLCNEMLEKELLTDKVCKKMASICEKFEDYSEAITFLESAMEINPELDFYKKIERLEKKF